MTLLALIASAEAMLFSASRAKRGQAQRQRLLMGEAADSVRALPLLEDYLRRKTAGASKIQALVAAKVTQICRQAVHTRSFEYLVLHLIRSAIHRSRQKLSISKLEVPR